MKFNVSKKMKVILIAGVGSFLVITSVITVLVGMWIFRAVPTVLQASQGIVTEVAGQSTEALQAVQKIESHGCVQLIRQSLDPSVWLSEPIGPRVSNLYQTCLFGETPESSQEASL